MVEVPLTQEETWGRMERAAFNFWNNAGMAEDVLGMTNERVPRVTANRRFAVSLGSADGDHYVVSPEPQGPVWVSLRDIVRSAPNGWLVQLQGPGRQREREVMLRLHYRSEDNGQIGIEVTG